MRHQKKHGMKLGTDASHTKAMKKSLVRALLTNDRIKTTLTRAKAIRPEVDKVVTWAKRGDLHARRLAIAAVGDAELVRETFDKAAQGMWQDRSGGYTRIMKLGTRKGDNAEIAIIELVQEAAPASNKAGKSTKPAAKISKVAKATSAVSEKKPAADEKKNEPSDDKQSGGSNITEPEKAASQEPAKDDKSASEEAAKDEKTAPAEAPKEDKPAPADASKDQKDSPADAPKEEKAASDESPKDEKEAPTEDAKTD